MSHKLNWSHICELVKINNPLERSFYEKQIAIANWKVGDIKEYKKKPITENTFQK